MGKKQLAMVLGVLGVMLAGALIFLYLQVKEAGDMWPAENQPGTLKAEIGRLQREVDALNEEVKKIPGTREQLEAIKIEHELATRVLPRESSPDQLLAAIRTKAESSNVQPVRLVPTVGGAAARGRGGASSFETWSFTLEIKGSYDQIATFINRMEEFESADPSRVGSEKRFFRVTDIEINSELNGLAGLGGMLPHEVTGHSCLLTMQTYRYTGGE